MEEVFLVVSSLGEYTWVLMRTNDPKAAAQDLLDSNQEIDYIEDTDGNLLAKRLAS